MPDRPWDEPGVEQVAPGVHRIPLPLPNDGLRAVNVYVIETADGLVLVDAGWALEESRDVLQRGLQQLGADLVDIVRFLVTHVHRDHYTQAVAIRREFGTRVELGIGERPTLEALNAPDSRPLAAQMNRLPTLGAGDLARTIGAAVADHRADQDQWEMPDAWLSGGVLSLPGGRQMEAVETPGHTAGHLVFHDLAAGLLFAGDHVLPTITPSVGFEPVPTASPLAAFLDSLALVRSRPDARLLPAHGPVAPSVHSRVDELVAHHVARLSEMEDQIRTQPRTAAEVAGAVGWTRRQRPLSELDPFNAMLAVFETAAHLDLLTAQGRAHVSDVDGVLLYSAVARADLGAA